MTWFLTVLKNEQKKYFFRKFSIFQNLKIEQFCVKITDDNTPSLSLFKKKLGFKQIGYSTAFKEFTFELPKNRLISEFSSFLEKNAEIKEYK